MTDIVLDIRDHLLVLAPHERDSRAAWQLRVAADEIERLRALADRRGEIAVNRRREVERLRTAIRRIAEQDGTLAIVNGVISVDDDEVCDIGHQ